MTIAEEYTRINRPLTEAIDSLTADEWRADTPCAGWQATDVVRHLIETQAALLSSAGLEPPVAPDIDADPAAAWRAHSQAMIDLLGDPAVADRTYDSMFGPTTVGRTMDTYYLFDMIVHRWDITATAGRPTVLTDAELDRIEAAIEEFGDYKYMDGIFKPGVEAAPDADRQTRVLAVMGRAA